MRRARLALGLVLGACSAPPETAPTPATTQAPQSVVAPRHAQIDGRAFPDHVLALTWDDGPDENTLRLADYLASEHISGTFFVVHEWASAISEEPGRGPYEFETGYMYLPILGDLVALGHRLGNHTANHVLLAGAAKEMVDVELRENQWSIDPFLTNELRLFRAPGGAWDDRAGRALDEDASLGGMVGPIRWDIDRKDWESSLFCRSDHPQRECEPQAPGHASRVKAEVTARRYLDSIEKAGHGIVLFHDRVGDVGSDYALRVAHIVAPELLRQGYVFAAPILEFSPFAPRLYDSQTKDWAGSLDPRSLFLCDVDGDGRADLCGTGAGGFACARSFERTRRGDGRPETVFGWTQAWSDEVAPPALPWTTESLQGDLNGDGRADECRVAPEGLVCSLAGPRGLLGSSPWLSSLRADAGWLAGVFALEDVNGDGRADVCSYRASDGMVACALAP
jgi:peptidoglycan/xylan/chitin deacetylase (PgdA/CDA1 family)